MVHNRKTKADNTFVLKKEEVNRGWILFDAAGKTLGRISTEIANVLRGKHKADFTPHVDSGDGVIVINADKIVVTGSKETQKVYRYYTGHIGGMREVPYKTMMAKKPGYAIEHAVWGMMPRTRLSRAQIKRLRVFAGSEHKMDAQRPIQVNI
ncbi:MAG: 50S ribosomal protein L13 [Waddliaceae bacterium]